MFGYIVHTFVIDEDIKDPKIFKDDFKSYLQLEFIISIVCCVIFIIFMREKPKNPPSNSQLNKDSNENENKTPIIIYKFSDLTVSKTIIVIIYITIDNILHNNIIIVYFLFLSIIAATIIEVIIPKKFAIPEI